MKMEAVKRTKIVITIGALLVLLVYLIHPFTVEPFVIILICLAIVPWLTSILKSVELPFGVKIEFQDLREIEEKAKKAGLVGGTQALAPESEYSFQAVAGEDPRLALAGLRIEIEKKLNDLANARGVPVSRKGISISLRELSDRQILTHDQSSVILDLLGILNKAVHGADIDARASQWALEVGVPLLRTLERKQ